MLSISEVEKWPALIVYIFFISWLITNIFQHFGNYSIGIYFRELLLYLF